MDVPLEREPGGNAVAVTHPATDHARVRMTVAYDGTDFRGFAHNTGVDVPTVGGTLARTLERLFQVPTVALACAGRTDRGVHAWGQVVSFDAPAARVADADRLANIARVINRNHSPTIVVRDIAIADPRFDARFSARSRTYRYTIVNRPVADPFLARTAWHVAAPLDLHAMILGCDPFIGLHEFGSFCRRPNPPHPDAPPATLMRRILDAHWEDAGDGILNLWIEASAFCHQMVRSIAGTLVEVGRGKKRAGDLMGIIGAQDRRAAGDLAPPQGLCLWQVRY